MKKLSEVCKIVGVTRRTLQEYDKIDLVKPTSKSESGYWLYDDAAIKKLILIQIFIEVGYERKAIKSLLESPALDLIVEFDHIIDTLEEKRKRIDGMINTIKTVKLTTQLPEGTLRAMRNLDVTRICHNKSFVSHLEDSIVHSAKYNEADYGEAKMYIPFWYRLVAIGCLLGTAEDTEPVQIAVEETYKYLMEIVLAMEDNSEEGLTETELAKSFSEAVQEIVSNPEIRQMLELQCGDGAVAYIIRAVHLFSDRKSRDSATSQEGEK